MLNQNIKNLRKQNGYTQETFAQELNVVRQTVSKWEKGYSVPDAVMLEKIAELFDVPVGALLGDTAQEQTEKPDLKEISEQLSILNNQFAKELARKKKIRKIALIVIVVVVLVIPALFFLCLLSLRMQGGSYEIDPGTNAIVYCHLDEALDDAVSAAILDAHPTSESSGECTTESHLVFGKAESGSDVTVYLREDYSHFGFVNGFFTDVGGGSTPVVLAFKKNDDGYQLISRETAQDGADYVPSIKRLFPARYAKPVLSDLPQEAVDQLWDNQAEQAQAYLRSIGRDATVCRYGEIKIGFLSDHNWITSETQSKISGMAMEYDTTVSNHERLEDGVRYVYQTAADEAKQCVTFTKFRFDTNKVVEFLAIDGKTGEVRDDVPAPASAKYHQGRLA